VIPTGVSLGYWQDRDPLEALETASIADDLGYRDLWLGEMATFDAFALATAVGLRTSRIALTIGPLAVSVRDPVMLAMGVATVAAVTGRRTDLAIGSSSPFVVAGWHGRAYDRLAARLGEAAIALRPLLAGERAANGYRLRLPPPGSSLTIAAFGPRAVAVAANLADRVVVNLCTPEAVADIAGRLGGGAPVLAAWIPAAVDPDETTLAQLRRALVPYLAAPGYAEIFGRAGFGDVVEVARSGAHPRDVLEAVPTALVEAVGIVGDAPTCRARLETFAAAGVDEIVLVPATAGDPGGRRTLTALGPSGAGALS
jgi:probable F420-dependent oxidoreductase